MRWSWLFVLVTVLSANAYAVASAQTESDAPAGYRALIEAGLKEYHARHFVEARALFLQAHTLSPNARTLRVLGMAEFEMRRYPQSLEYIEAALASTVHPLDAELREQMLDLQRRALAFVGRIHIELQPAAAEILLDDVVIPLPSSGVLILQAGEHTLEFRAPPAYRSEKRRLDIHGAEKLTLPIALERALLPQQAESEPPPIKSKPKFEVERKPEPASVAPWLWASGIGLVVVGAATALYFVLKPNETVEYGTPHGTPQTPVGARISALYGWP